MTPLTIDQICRKPDGAIVAAVRERHGFTQKQCAGIVGVTARAWQSYEAVDEKMPITTWWCFLLRISEILPSQLPPIPPRQRAGVMVHVLPG